MMSDSGYTFVLASWKNNSSQIRDLRNHVFKEELKFSEQFVEDGTDADAYHVMVYDAGSRPVGTARMQPDGVINYVAVLNPWRGKTVGGALVSYLVHIAGALKLDSVWAETPVQASPFLEKNRFVKIGEEFSKQDVVCYRMVRNIAQPEVLH